MAEHLSCEQNVTVGAEHIVMTCGTAGALNVILKALLDPEDEVLIPVPCFMEYCFYIDNHGDRVKFVPTRPDFSLDFDAMAAAITSASLASGLP